MPGKKDTKNIEIEESINTLRHCFSYLLRKFNEDVRKLPEDVRSNNENLIRTLSKTMWTINMLFKSVLGDDAVTHIEQIQVDESSIDLRLSLNEMYEIMRALNSLMISEFHSDT